MTIESIIEELEDLQIDVGSCYDDANLSPLYYALDAAIKSLEAWYTVKAEIKDIKDLYDLGKEDLSTRMFIEGVETVEQIIDKHLKEVN